MSRKHRTSTTRIGALALGTTLALAATAHAQGESRSGSRERHDPEQQRRGRPSEPRQSPQRGSAGDDVTWRLEPQSWVAVGYDFDGDGRYDAVEYVFGYDLIQARESSEKRARQKGSSREAEGRTQAREAGFPRDMAERSRREGRSSAAPATYRTSGEIRELRRVELVGQDDPHVVATLRTDSGKQATVNLGPQPDVSRMELREGDRIEVVGTLGKTDERPMLMADRVRHDGETFGVDRPDDRDLQRFEGTIRELREVRYRDLDERHFQARVELREGGTTIVDLGPTSELSDATLATGKRIEFLADRVRIDGRPALRAEQLKLDGERFELDRDAERRRLQSASSRQGGSGSR